MIKTFVAENLKVLRKRRRQTQEEVSSIFHCTRSTYNNYENNISMTPLDILVLSSDYYGITLDNLVKVDLHILNEYQLREILKK
jgi:transcriptional regulator with XRE-family HTH domain